MTETLTAAPSSRATEPSTNRAAALVENHELLMQDVTHRAAAVQALLDARRWPHEELATLVGYLRATLLRQVSDEESRLYPHDATAAPFAELSADHAALHDLTQRLEQARIRRCSIAELRSLVEELVTSLRRHLIQEQGVLALRQAAEVSEPAGGPVVIPLDALPTRVAKDLCIERVLRMRPGERAEVDSGDRARLREVWAWLREFDAGRFGFALSSTRDGAARLDIACRDPR